MSRPKDAAKLPGPQERARVSLLLSFRSQMSRAAHLLHVRSAELHRLAPSDPKMLPAAKAVGAASWPLNAYVAVLGGSVVDRLPCAVSHGDLLQIWHRAAGLLAQREALRPDGPQFPESYWEVIEDLGRRLVAHMDEERAA